jgi:hypothetical protein
VVTRQETRFGGSNWPLLLSQHEKHKEKRCYRARTLYAAIACKSHKTSWVAWHGKERVASGGWTLVWPTKPPPDLLGPEVSHKRRANEWIRGAEQVSLFFIPRSKRTYYEIEERASKIDFSLPGCLSIFLGHGTNMQQRIYHTWGWCPLLPVLARRSPLPGIFQYRLAGWFVHDASARVSHLGHDASAVPAWNATARIPVSTRKIICISSNILFSTRKWHCALDESRCQTGCDFLWLLIEENVQFFPVYFKTK